MSAVTRKTARPRRVAIGPRCLDDGWQVYASRAEMALRRLWRETGGRGPRGVVLDAWLDGIATRGVAHVAEEALRVATGGVPLRSVVATRGLVAAALDVLETWQRETS